MQNIFQRYEKKYIISKEQSVELKAIISQHMKPDYVNEYLVQNLYYDTQNWDIIRASIEKPLYKEKLRLRCYGIPNQESNVFLEIKKKFNDIVCKRRVAIPFRELSFRRAQDIVAEGTSQISRELDYYIKANAVSEKILIAYRRAAFTGMRQEAFTDEAVLRITFDTDIYFRLDHLDYLNSDYGIMILPQDNVLIEIKSPGGMPLWLARFLSENRIFPASFSKYGECYTGYIMKRSELSNLPSAGRQLSSVSKLPAQIEEEARLSA